MVRICISINNNNNNNMNNMNNIKYSAVSVWENLLYLSLALASMHKQDFDKSFRVVDSLKAFLNFFRE